jgi:ribosomal protein L14E/L6E/L27E
MGEDKQPQVGHIVKILRGRDFGKFAIIIGLVDQRFALIADGDKRKFDHPKKKNLLHLELQNEISDVVVNSLLETGRVTNGKLRYALAKYENSIEPEA